MLDKKRVYTVVKSALRPLRNALTGWLEIKSGIFLEKTLAPLSDGASHTGFGRVERVDGTDPALPYAAETLAYRRESGSSLYALYINDTIATYGWLAGPGSRIGILHDLALTVPPGGVYIWDCVTRPPFRGQGCFPQFLAGLPAACGANPVLAQVAVDTRNAASRRALAKAGFKPSFSYTSIRCFGRVLSAFSSDERGWHRGQTLFDEACRLSGTRIS